VNLDQRVQHFVEALFSCWRQQVEDCNIVNGQRVMYINADEFYFKMHLFGFAFDIKRFVELTNVSHYNKLVEKLRLQPTKLYKPENASKLIAMKVAQSF
jgi:hypothetical protein